MAVARTLMAKVAHAYYREQKTQAEIGNQLGLSRHKVGRILKEALNTGLVRIEINPEFAEAAVLEERLESVFGLKGAIVVEADPELDDIEVKRRAAQAAADYLQELIKPGDVIGVGWGSTTFEVVNRVQPAAVPGAAVVQITGGNKAVTPQFSCQEVTRRLAEKLSVEPVLLHAPGILDRKETRDALLRERIVAETFEWFRKLRIALVGVGSLVPEAASTLLTSGYISKQERDELLRSGVVGDVFSYFIDEEGAPVGNSLNDRLVTIGIEEIRRIPYSIGVATGAVKTRAVRAAIRGGYINVLVSDSQLAQALIGTG